MAVRVCSVCERLRCSSSAWQRSSHTSNNSRRTSYLHTHTHTHTHMSRRTDTHVRMRRAHDHGPVSVSSGLVDLFRQVCPGGLQLRHAALASCITTSLHLDAHIQDMTEKLGQDGECMTLWVGGCAQVPQASLLRVYREVFPLGESFEFSFVHTSFVLLLVKTLVAYLDLQQCRQTDRHAQRDTRTKMPVCLTLLCVSSACASCCRTFSIAKRTRRALYIYARRHVYTHLHTHT